MDRNELIIMFQDESGDDWFLKTNKDYVKWLENKLIEELTKVKE